MTDAHRKVMEAAVLETVQRRSELAISAGLCGYYQGSSVCCDPGQPGPCTYSMEIGPTHNCQCCTGCRKACARDI